jgi:hypothetical protein
MNNSAATLVRVVELCTSNKRLDFLHGSLVEFNRKPNIEHPVDRIHNSPWLDILRETRFNGLGAVPSQAAFFGKYSSNLLYQIKLT